MIKNTPIRILLVFGALSLSGILFTQIYWVSKAIRNEEQQFSHSVQMAMRSVVESLCELNGYDFDHDPIEQVANNYFIARANNRINLTSLGYLLRAEFEKRAINQDFEFGVYDCQTDRMVYGDLISFGKDEQKPLNGLPKLLKDEYYFGVYFPSKSAGIGQLGIWQFTSLLTIVIVLFFGYALFVILKQKRLSEVQRDFINNMTHELKTPLATLKLSADVLKQESTTPRARKYAQIVEEESTRLEQQVARVLEQTNERLFLSQAKQEQVAIEEMMGRITDRFASQTVKWEVKLEPAQLLTHVDLLEQVLFNLIENAVKYGAGWVAVIGQSQGKFYELQITNRCIPIPESARSKIFDQFYRLPTGDRHDVKGFGLGLYLVKKAMPVLKSKIDVKSTDALTTFILKLPLKP